MSRRGNGRKTDKFGCWYRPQFEAIEESILSLRARYLQTLSNDFTLQDVMDVFVRPEWHERSKEAFRDFEADAPHSIRFSPPSSLPGLELRAAYNWAARRDFSGNNPAYRNTECDAYKRFVAWCTERRDIGIKFGLVRAVHRELMYRCANPHEVRYFWPCVRMLLHMAGDSFAAKLEKPRHIPEYTLPKSLRDAAYEAHTLVVSTLMLPEPKQGKANPTVVINPILSYPTGPLPWAADGVKAKDSMDNVMKVIPSL